jgi:ElaA protein
MITYKIKHFDELTNHEVYDMLQLRADVFVIEQKCIYQDCDNKDKESFHLLLYKGNQLVAYCRLMRKGLSYAEYCSIGRVVTHPLFRHQKHGLNLMLKAIDFCKTTFNESIKISAQAYLEKFYTDLGFNVVSEPYLEDDIPHIAMTLK